MWLVAEPCSIIRRRGVLSAVNPTAGLQKAAVALFFRFDLVFQRNFRWDDRALNASFHVLVAHVIAGDRACTISSDRPDGSISSDDDPHGTLM
jgi:hypothetical protein